jgi:hypothetical protein
MADVTGTNNFFSVSSSATTVAHTYVYSEDLPFAELQDDDSDDEVPQVKG